MANLPAVYFIVPKFPRPLASGSVALAILTACITGEPQAFADNPAPAQQPPTSASSTGSATATTDAPQPVKQPAPAVDNTAAAGQPAPGPVQLARELFNVACPNGGCSAALQKEHAAALTNAEAAHAEACVQLCMHTPTQCPGDPWHMCLLGRSDCEMLGPMVCGLMGQ